MSQQPSKWVGYDASTRNLVTPEGVNLRTRLADVGLRISAFFIDLIILITALFLFFWIVDKLPIPRFGRFAEFVTVLVSLVVFFLRFFYFTGFEASRRAATPGKMLLKIRVASRTSPRLDANAVFVRNVMRELEFFLPISLMFYAGMGGVQGAIYTAALIWAAIFLFFPLFNRDRMRAGDLLAGTWVVRSPRPKLLADLSDATPIGDFAFTPAQIEAYGVRELHVLEDVLRANQGDVVADVARRIRRKIEWTPSASEKDRDFLDAYYRALRARLESRMLFGVRRTDKHDKR